jgi:putative FmdB family regulatory protein
MPLYEYECDACGRRFEKILKFSDPPVDRCDLCGKGPVHKLQSSPAIQFKGSGWYITDYPKKGATDGGDSASSNGAGSKEKTEKAEKTDKPAEKSEAKPADTKPPSSTPKNS